MDVRGKFGEHERSMRVARDSSLKPRETSASGARAMS